MNEITTTDFAKFGNRERAMAEDLLKAWREQGLPDNFSDDEVTIMMNTSSGNVFLTNSEYQAAMMNGDSLEMWLYCVECGNEGFGDDDIWENNTCCKEYISSFT